MSELERIRHVYENRKQSKILHDRYSAFDPVHLFFRTQRQRAIQKLLIAFGVSSLSTQKILEVGCGSGSVLQDFTFFGAYAQNLFGIDLLHSRMSNAGKRLPTSTFLCANGSCLPLPDNSFDIVVQFTALSSILDPSVRKNIACEMQRVLRPKGLIIWYDFFWNPLNPDTRGIGKNEILANFPDCSFKFYRTTLMPPLARRVVPISWPFSLLLESMQLLNGHYLVGIQKNVTPSPAL